MPLSPEKLMYARREMESVGFKTYPETNDGRPVVLKVFNSGALSDLADALNAQRCVISTLLTSVGSLLVQGLPISSAQEFRRVATGILGKLSPYQERSSPRRELDDGIYTSTDYPPGEQIFLHNENSYRLTWPSRLAFCCLTPSQTGGETPTADLRLVREAIPLEILDEFRRRGWMLIRNYREELGLSWQEVFGTQDRAAVDKYCQLNNLVAEWLPGGNLRTRTVGRQVCHVHPTLGIEVWFNHATFWHISTLPSRTKEALISMYAPDELPASTYYGDGSPIPDDVVARLREAYTSARRQHTWSQGDVLLVDNMLAAHGRNAFQGDRRIAVAMS